MSKYRIDFSRLARNEEEILKQKQVEEFLSLVIGSMTKDKTQRAMNKHNDFCADLEKDGHILDSLVFESNEVLNGKEILSKFVHHKYPEAKLMSWDFF